VYRNVVVSSVNINGIPKERKWWMGMGYPKERGVVKASIRNECFD